MANIESIQEELYEIRLELEGYAALLCAANGDEFNANALYGAGIRFSKISDKIQQINDDLSCCSR